MPYRVRGGGDLPPQSILDGVRSILRTQMAVAGPVGPATDLTEELQLDSLAQLTLIVEIENHFRICFGIDDEQSIQTVGDVVQVIEKHLPERKETHA